MKVKFVSDFHSEFFGNASKGKFERILDRYFLAQEGDKDTVLCCAGDMGTMGNYASSYKPLLEILGRRFKHVICIPGNHTWYNTAGVWDHEKEWWANTKLPKNVSYIDNDVKVIDDVVFIGSCLWTSFNDLNFTSMLHARHAMNDFQCIKKRNYEVSHPYGVISSSKLTPELTVTRHYDSVGFLKSAFRAYAGMKVVVISHHLPSWRSVPERFKHDLLSDAYATELSYLIDMYQPAVWLHGHTHDSCDYNIGKTRVLCNPLGYHAVCINLKFDPELVMDI